jgi:hypothetical protein
VIGPLPVTVEFNCKGWFEQIGLLPVTEIIEGVIQLADGANATPRKPVLVVDAVASGVIVDVPKEPPSTMASRRFGVSAVVV